MNIRQEIPTNHTSSKVKEDVPTLDELDGFIEALDDYKQDVFSSRRSKGRSSGSSSKVTPARNASIHPPPQKPSPRVHPVSNIFIHIPDHSDTISTVSSALYDTSVQFSSSTPVSWSETPLMSSRIPDITIPAGDRREATKEHSSARSNSHPNAQARGSPSSSILKGHPGLPERFIIGRHMIEMTATNFYLNGQEITFVSAYDYALANKFLSALREHGDKLDGLDNFLRGRGPEGPWRRIPGWSIG